MAAKKATKQVDYTNPPETLKDHPFFGFILDEKQQIFRDCIYSDDHDIIFVDAKAGSGKTTVAIATSVIMHKYGLCDDIVYIVHPISDKQGYLPGTITEKSSVYFEALYQALTSCNEFPERAIKSSLSGLNKEDSGYITAITDSYLRGSNIGDSRSKTIMIVDEAQNFDEFSLRKVLTRACKNTKVIVIGHQLQCDLSSFRDSGFKACMEHFRAKENERFAFCTLNTCHRSLVAQVADEPWNEWLLTQPLYAQKSRAGKSDAQSA